MWSPCLVDGPEHIVAIPILSLPTPAAFRILYTKIAPAVSIAESEVKETAHRCEEHSALLDRLGAD